MPLAPQTDHGVRRWRLRGVRRWKRHRLTKKRSARVAAKATPQSSLLEAPRKQSQPSELATTRRHSEPHGARSWKRHRARIAAIATSRRSLSHAPRLPTLLEAPRTPTHISKLARPRRFSEPDPRTLRQIDMDLPRTHLDDVHVEARLDLVRTVLVRQSTVDTELDYCQGMNFVAATFALAHCSEEDVFNHFHDFVTGMRGLWLPGFPLMKEGAMHFEALAESCAWFQHFRKNQVSPDKYLPRMWLSLFSAWLPLSFVSQFTGLLEREGFAGVLAMTLACLDHHGERLLGMDSEDALLQALRPECLIEAKVPHQDSFSRAVAAWLPTAAASLLQLPVVSGDIDEPALEGSANKENQGSEGLNESEFDVFFSAKKQQVKHDFDNILSEAQAAVVAGKAAGRKTVQGAKREVDKVISDLNAAHGKMASFVKRSMPFRPCEEAK